MKRIRHKVKSLNVSGVGKVNVFSFFLIFFFAQSVFSQIEYLEQYHSSKYLPSELNENSTDRIKLLFEHYANKQGIESKKEQKEYEDFVYRSNYFLEKLNKSGEVFYGDTISSYLNQLKDYLLLDHPLKSDIRVYLTRNPSFNAFTNDFGNIYVNIAALSKLKSETQLLALLSHEISHILNNHTHKFEEFRSEVEKDAWKKNIEKEVLGVHAFSKQQEYEADLEGFKLLKKRKINLHDASGIFEQLRYDLNPSIGEKTSFKLLSAGDTFLAVFFKNVGDSIDNQYLKIKEVEDDSLRTHPLTVKRLEVISDFIKDEEKAPNTNIGNFQFFTKLANLVLIDSYIENGWFIECLDHVVKLRKEDPSSDYLIVAQAKLLLLLTQAKYNATPYSQFINDKGSAYNDSAFLELKETILTYNSIDINLASILIVKNLMQESKNAYLKRVNGFLIKFLYKYNEKLFKNENGELQLISAKECFSQCANVNSMELFFNLTKDEAKNYKKVKTKNNLISVSTRNIEASKSIISYFLSSYSLSNQDRTHIESYKIQREGYETMLTIDEVLITLSPRAALNYYRRGNYTKSNKDINIEDVALVQSSNLFLYNAGAGYQIDFQESLDLEKQIVKVLKGNSIISQNYSNLATKELTMDDINKHYFLNIWIMERFQFNDLIYSAVDEQIEKFKTESDIQYLLYNLNVASKNPRGKSRKHITFGYNVVFDLSNEGVTYISKIASTEKGNNQIFSQLFHLSNFNMK